MHDQLFLNDPVRRAFWLNRRVFLTGGFGLLGSHIAEYLVKLGASVVLLKRDHVPSSRLFETDAYRKSVIVQGDFEDYDTIYRTLADYEIETVFHVGAQAIAPIANRSPLPTFRANIMGTCNVLEAARLNPTVKRVLVASSDKAYGDQPILPYTEDAPLQGKHPYDVSKSCTDLIAQTYVKTYNSPICVTRCGNLYGAGDLNFNRIIPDTIRQALNDKAITIRSDGQFIRDYFFVKDAAMGYLAIAQAMEDESVRGHAFNLSTGNGYKVVDIVAKIYEVMGKTDLSPTILNQASSEIREQTLSSKKAETILGWKPVYSVEEGLSETVSWYRQYFEHLNTEQLPAGYDSLLS